MKLIATVAFLGFVLIGSALVMRLMMSEASPIPDLALPAAVAPVAPTSIAVPPTAAAPPQPAAAASEVPPPDALHRYAVDAVVGLMPAYAERNLETKEDRLARWTTFANECADAVEAAGVKEQAEYVVSLIFIAHRESVLAKNPRHVGNEDEGLAFGPWQIHEWKGMDRARAATALDLLIHAPGAWSLPSKPWLGLAADKRLNRPSAVAYLHAHPFQNGIVRE
jgi:hypothetical protein